MKYREFVNIIHRTSPGWWYIIQNGIVLEKRERSLNLIGDLEVIKVNLHPYISCKPNFDKPNGEAGVDIDIFLEDRK